MARKVCDAATPATPDGFSGVEHGLFGHHDIFKITRKHIKKLGLNAIKLFLGSSECNDFSKLRLLQDRPDWKGPPRDPNVDPRKGLDGKHGATFRQVIAIWGWVLEFNPDCKFFIENVDFMDMLKHWKEGSDALGTPVMVDAHDHSFTKRRRAYWTNIVLPSN